ncbi:DUF2254 domain-containing protein [Lacinutrix salivirga]
MKDKLFTFLRYFYRLKDKIAFFPSIIAFAGCVFAYVMFYLESKGISKYLLDTVPEIVINNTETARVLLTTFIAGLISIMVFSFSMVMILLNQASSNFSPRLLPGLISNRRHQIILGTYIATILYCIFILVSIKPNSNKYQLPGFSVLLAIIFMVLCLGAFIYFIHSISQEIQINNIMDKIFNKAEKRLTQLINSEKDKTEEFPDTNNWKDYKVKSAAYLQNISIDSICNIAKENDAKIYVAQIKGMFILDEDILFKTNKKLDEETIESIYRNFDFSKSELVEDNYIFAFKQITEVAVKAMSPGINDPGTAINAIDYLSKLFYLRLQKKDISIAYTEDEPLVLLNTLSFEKLLYQVMAALRTYCKHDVILVQKLLAMLNHLNKHTTNKMYSEAIKKEITNLISDAKTSIDNKMDLSILE